MKREVIPQKSRANINGQSVPFSTEPETNLEVSHRAIERIIPQASLLIQEFAGLPVDWWTEQAIVETLLQLLPDKHSTINPMQFARRIHE